jgi:hypothetical protein
LNRWEHGRLPLRRLEDRVLRAAPPGRVRSVGESVHLLTRTKGVQPADGSDGTSRHRVGLVLRLARQERLPDPVRCVAGGALLTDVQGLSAKPAAGEFQHRPDGRRIDEGDHEVGFSKAPASRDHTRLAFFGEWPLLAQSRHL